jgi:hypothetical protein
MDAKFVCQTVGVAQTFPHIQQLGKQDLTSEQTTFNFGQQNIQALSVSGTREWQGKFVGTSSKGKKPSKRVWNKGTNPSVPEELVRALHKTQE